MIEPRKIPWNRTAAEALAPALGLDVHEIRRQVEEGVAELFIIPAHGYLVTRIEQAEGQPPELVLVAGAGHGLDAVVEAFREIARRNGIGSLRAHCRRPGMARMLGRHGFYVLETVYRAEIA